LLGGTKEAATSSSAGSFEAKPIVSDARSVIKENCVNSNLYTWGNPSIVRVCVKLVKFAGKAVRYWLGGYVVMLWGVRDLMIQFSCHLTSSKLSSKL
jgi:hypothetical protein